MFRAFDLVDKERLIVFKILVADNTVVVLRGGSLVTFELSFGLEVSVTVREGARNELARVYGSHLLGVVGVEELCNRWSL